MFPDLLRDVFTNTHIIGTRYRFTTNGRVVAQPLKDLLAEIGRIGPDANPLSVLDNSQAKFPFRQERLTARAFFTKIMQASGCCDGDAKRLWNFLYRFEINDLVSEQSSLDRIDKLLSLLVDDRNTIDSTRDALLGQLLQRARAGETVTPVEILSTANLNWNILEKRNQIRARLREQTSRMIASEQYDRSLDARASALSLTENWFTVLTGESGRGKTWQLLRLAHDYLEQRKSCVFLRDIQSIENLEKALLNILWHQSGYDRTLPLGNALERIADVLPKLPEPLLTVFLDDVQNRDFAIQLLDSYFNQLRLRFVLTAQPRIAAALENSFRRQPHIIPIDRFTLRELRNYLLKRQIDWAKLPSDVLELLKQPILAKLYVDIAQEGWSPETEYALLDRYWRHVTIERREQDDHPQDAVTLKALAMKLFDGIRYPWPQRAALEVGFTDDVQLRLISVGLIRRDADQRIALFHDRLLNWVVAKALAERVLDRDLSLEYLREMFLRILRVDTGWRDDNLVSRLGYIPMDVLWLLTESIPPDQIADLINELVRGDRLGEDSSAIFFGLLSTLGRRILPALEQFAVRHLSTEDVWTLGSDVAKGVVVAGDSSATILQPLITRLIESVDLSVQRVGLTIAATVPLRDQIERIWALHRIYGIRRVEMEKFDGALEYLRYEISLDALVNAAGTYPDWVARKICATQNEDDLVELVYLMMKLKREIGIGLWGKTKECLFERLPAGRRCLSQAIGHFRDKSCIDWLLCVDANGHEPLAIEIRFGALVRLVPNKALEFLKMMSTDGPFRSTKSWWLRPLIQKLGEPAQVALRRFFDDGKWTGVRNLAILFQDDEDLVDDETLTLIIDTFEARLEDNDHVEDWQFTGEGHFLRLLSKIRSPRLLRMLEAKGGSRFEDLLARRTVQDKNQNSGYS